MTDREEAGLRGSVRICVEETTYPTGKSLTTTEYGPDGRLLTTRASNSDGSECFTTKTYEADGRLVKTSSAKSGEPATETSMRTMKRAGSRRVETRMEKAT